MTSATTHSVPVNLYLADVIIPFGGSQFVLSGLQIMEWVAPQGVPYQALIGRDILCKGAFTLSWDGHFTWCM